MRWRCRLCREAQRELDDARVDKTLHPNERVQLIQDLRAQLTNCLEDGICSEASLP